MTDDLHGVFAHTIYGDNVRVSYYGPWNDTIKLWDALETNKRVFPLVKFFVVRSWTDPAWNTARYRPSALDTVLDDA